jgi:hypothetical protein
VRKGVWRESLVTNYTPGEILYGIKRPANTSKGEIMAVFFTVDGTTLRLVERVGATGFGPCPENEPGGCPYHGSRPCLEADDGMTLPCAGVRGWLFEDGQTFVLCGATTRAECVCVTR